MYYEELDETTCSSGKSYERDFLRKKRVLLLIDEIYFSTSEKFIQDMEMLTFRDAPPITIIISSPGGQAFAGNAIIRSIQKAQDAGIQVIGQVHGLAASMAFFILQCCDTRVMGTFDMLMCHGITTFTYGDMKNMDSEQKLLTTFQENYSTMLANRVTTQNPTYSDPAYWAEKLRDNTPEFYDHLEAVEMGLVDLVE